MREVPAAVGGDRPQEVEGMSEASDRGDKRPRSEAGSDNPRPRSTSRTTREEQQQQQSTADGNFDEMDWDSLEENASSISESSYHLLDAPELAMQFGNIFA